VDHDGAAAGVEVFHSQQPELLTAKRQSSEELNRDLIPQRGLRIPQLVRLDAEKDSPKFEKAALRWLARFLVEGSPRLEHFAELTASLAKLKSEKDPASNESRRAG
jgi:hypothetical protein